MKTALITGVTGQDGSYLAELLVAKGYQVHGAVRRSSSFNTGRIDHLLFNRPPQTLEQLTLHYGDVTDSSNLNRLIEKINPGEVYHLAGQSHVRVSFDLPEYTAEVNALGTLRLLDAIRASGVKTRFYQASTSELFGQAKEVPQTEKTPFYPRSPYAIAKLYAHWAVVHCREAYGLHASNGILFNHESPRRGESFVSRKITLGAARIKAGKQDKIILGNLAARRDWGYAPEYVEGMWRMLQQPTADDYVLATGEAHSVREFVEAAFEELGMEITWSGQGGSERAVLQPSGKTVVEVSPDYVRPTEVDFLLGDASKAQKQVGWKAGTTFRDLVKLMVRADWELVTKH